MAPRLGKHDRPGCVDDTSSPPKPPSCPHRRTWRRRHEQQQPVPNSDNPITPTALVENPVVAVESEITVEEACDVNHLLRPHPHPRSSVHAARRADPGGITASSCSPKALHASPSSPPISPQRRRDTLACSTYVSSNLLLLLSRKLGITRASLTRRPRPSICICIVCRRECVLDFRRDPTHVYPRAPAGATARRSDPRSRKGRPRSRAAREQYVSLVPGSPYMR